MAVSSSSKQKHGHPTRTKKGAVYIVPQTQREVAKSDQLSFMGRPSPYQQSQENLEKLITTSSSTVVTSNTGNLLQPKHNFNPSNKHNSNVVTITSRPASKTTPNAKTGGFGHSRVG